jgi:hypothetical protein
VNGEIIYTPNSLNDPVLILFSTMSNGGFENEHFSEEKSLIYRKIIYNQKICHDLIIKIS